MDTKGETKASFCPVIFAALSPFSAAKHFLSRRIRRNIFQDALYMHWNQGYLSARLPLTSSNQRNIHISMVVSVVFPYPPARPLEHLATVHCAVH